MTTAARGAMPAAWPELPASAIQPTVESLHRRLQIVGKTRLALAPPQNHWWHVTQYVTARGLTTSPMPHGAVTLEVTLDFIEHRLTATTSAGASRSLPLVAEPLADFYAAYRALLRALDVDVPLWPVPSEMADTLRFDRDRGHAAYDPAIARRVWEALVRADRALHVFRGRFVGKCSPVHFWWGGFDLACTRFSGRRAPPHPGGIPNLPDRVTREAYSHECISAGWWPGSADSPVTEPAFYAYAYPEPAGCPDAAVRPAAAAYHPELREWILPWTAVRAAADPEATVLEFLESTYEVAANFGGWNRAELERGA